MLFWMTKVARLLSRLTAECGTRSHTPCGDRILSPAHAAFAHIVVMWQWRARRPLLPDLYRNADPVKHPVPHCDAR